jgi:predicted  nucleic acid-binding Zn ribbon protein
MDKNPPSSDSLCSRLCPICGKQMALEHRAQYAVVYACEPCRVIVEYPTAVEQEVS